MNQAEAAAMRFGVRSLTDAMWDKLAAEREVAPPEQQLDLEELPLAPVPDAGSGSPTDGQPREPLPSGRRKSLGSLARNLNG